MRRAARIDGNQKELDLMARKLGCMVIRASLAPELGFDRIYVRQGQVFICEIKDENQPPSKRKLTDNELETKAELERAGGTYHVLESRDDLQRMLGL